MSATFTVCKVLLIDKSLSNTTGKIFYDGFQDLTTFPCKYQSLRPCFTLWSNSFKAEIEVGFISTVGSALPCPSGSLNHHSKTWKLVCSPTWQEKLTLPLLLAGTSKTKQVGHQPLWTFSSPVGGHHKMGSWPEEALPSIRPSWLSVQGELSIPTWVFLKGIESSWWHWIWCKSF